MKHLTARNRLARLSEVSGGSPASDRAPTIACSCGGIATTGHLV
jgi:hypothetical protein